MDEIPIYPTVLETVFSRKLIVVEMLKDPDFNRVVIPFESISNPVKLLFLHERPDLSGFKAFTTPFPSQPVYIYAQGGTFKYYTHISKTSKILYRVDEVNSQISFYNE